MGLKEKSNILNNKKSKLKSKTNLEIPNLIAEQQIRLDEFENKIKRILNDTYTKNSSEETFSTQYLDLMSELDSFLEQCKAIKEEAKHLHLDEDYLQINSITKKATNYKHNFPDTKEKAYQYIEKKLYELNITNFKLEEAKFVISIDRRFNELLIKAKNLDEQTYYNLLEKIKKDIESHEIQYQAYSDISARLGFEKDAEMFNKLYNNLQNKKQILTVPYYTAVASTKQRFALRKIKELEQEIDRYNQRLMTMKSLRTEEGLFTIEAKINAIALLNSLMYFVNNFNRISNETTEKIIFVEAELVECDIRNKEISKEIIRLSMLAKTNTKYLAEKKQKEKLTKIQQEIRLEKEAKKLELALLVGEAAEVSQYGQTTESELVTTNTKLLRLEKQLLELEKIGQTRTDIYLKLKSEYIKTVKDATSLKYYDEHYHEVKTLTDQNILTINQNLEGLLAKKKVMNMEMFRIYGLKSLANLSVHESMYLSNYEIQAANLEKEIHKHKLKLVPLLSQKQEEDYLSNHKSSNTNAIEQELISREAHNSGVNKYLEQLEKLGVTESKDYLDAKIKSIDIQYDIERLKSYLNHLSKVSTDTDLKYLMLASEIKGHIARAINIEQELERITKLPNATNTNMLKRHIATLTKMHEEDSKAIEIKEKDQELTTIIVDFNNKKETIKSRRYKIKVKN